MKRFMFFMVMCLCSLTALAADFTVDGINYNITSAEKKTVEVTNGIIYQGDVVIPESVEYERINYSVTSIGRSAFSGCRDLATISIPNSVTSICYQAFMSCSGLTFIKLPNSLITIEYEAFSRCSGLTSVDIPNTVTTIGGRAFNNCSGLTSFTIPNSVTKVGDESPFQGCINLTSIYVEKDNNVYDSRENCNAIIETSTNTLIAGCKNTKIPNTVTSIGYNSMCGFQNLTSISIPSSVTSIEFGAFQSCGLISISIPNSVISIGYGAFGRCSGLISLTIPNSVTTIDERVFNGCYQLSSITIDVETPFAINENVFPEDIYTTASLTVPNGTVEAYKSTEGWCKFTNIKEKNSINKKAEAVDLGLSVKWASWNLGAGVPEEYGYYFAWGETAPKEKYDWSTYKFGEESNHTKYNSTDGLTQLELEDDAAFVIWGKGWRMPTHEEELELANECTWEDVEVNGISGYKITGPNGNSIFMPRGGIYDGTDYECDGTTLSNVNTCGWYWSSTLNTTGSSYAQGLCFFPSLINNVCDHERCDGHNIRPVYVGYESSEMTITTLIFDASSQPMLVGGMIDNYSSDLIAKKGIIVSKNLDDMIITDNTRFDKAEVILKTDDYKDDVPFDSSTFDIRFIDCTGTNEEEYACALMYLTGNTDYYVKAFVIDKESNIFYGNPEKVHTQDYYRFSGYADYANVWHAFDYTLFDLVTDEILDPDAGFYYSTNENPTNVSFQTGSGYNTCYKYATEWNYRLWYYQRWNREYWDNNHGNYFPLHIPVMKYANGNLIIEKNPLDIDKDITIYYSINGNYFRPETYTNIYTGPLEINEPCTVYCYSMSSDGYISYTNMYVVSDVMTGMSVETKIFDANSQPPIVGGMIDNYSSDLIAKKGIIVSKNLDDMIITEETEFDKANMFLCPADPRNNNPHDIRFIDCTGTNEEEYACALQFLEGNTDYYVKAYVIDADGNVYYGETETIHTQDYNRCNRYADFANVYDAFTYTLFDVVTDEIIVPSGGFYYTTNESSTRVRYQTGTNTSISYKLATEWNYNLWYSQVYYGTVERNSSSVVHLPVMKYKNGLLTIERNSQDADKDLTIYYSINGNYFRPETYTEIYTNPIVINEPCAVYCYAISSDGYVSYTNMYVVGDYTINENENDNSGFVEVCGIRWAKGNLQYDAVNGGNDTFQENWKIAPNQWYYFRYDEGLESYEVQKSDNQVDHFTWGACGDWDYLHDVTIYSTAKNTDICSKMYVDANCETETTDYKGVRYGDIAYWASKGQYRMPTVKEIDVLINTASYQYGYYLTADGIKVYGFLFTTPNGYRTTNNSEKQFTDEDLSIGLFLPFTGGSHSNQTIIEGKGSYWGSTVEEYPQSLAFDSYPVKGQYDFYDGQWRTDFKSIRPIYIQTLPAADDNGSVDYGYGEINENTDLTSSVIGNIYYNISDDCGEYSSIEGCIVLRKTTPDTDMSELEGMDIFGEDFKEDYTGIVFMVRGSGTIKITAETIGNMTLKVKIGKNVPTTMELEGKLKASIPYYVSEPTYIYIYGGETNTANAKGMNKTMSSNDFLKIYGIEWSGEPSGIGTGIETINEAQSANSIIYNLQGQRMQTLQKGVNIINGKKVLVR